MGNIYKKSKAANRTRAYTPATEVALRLLASNIKAARKTRRMPEQELADRLNIARSTLQRLEKGDPRVEIGLVFEAANLLGLSFFNTDERNQRAHLQQTNDRLALLPQRIRPTKQIDDGF